MKTKRPEKQFIYVNIIAWYILFALAINLSSCKTREVITQKQEQKTEIKKEEIINKTLDSTSIKKGEKRTKTEEKKDITNTNSVKEQITIFSKEKDTSGKQLIASVINRESNQVILDQSTFNKDDFQQYLDSLKRELKEENNLKIDSIGKSQNNTKEIKSDSTIQANLPWWIWIIALVGFYVVYLMIKK